MTKDSDWLLDFRCTGCPLFRGKINSIVEKAFILYEFIAVLTSLLLWYRGYRLETNSVHRRRLQIISVSFLFCSSLILLDFLPGSVLPVYPCSYIIITLCILFQTYAVFVYGFTKIQNSIILFLHHLIIAIILAIPWGIIFFLFFPLKSLLSWPAAWGFSLLAFGILVPYVPQVTPWIESIIFKKDFQYQKVIQAFTDEIVILKEPEKLVRSMQALLHKTLNMSSVRLITKKIKQRKYFYWTEDSCLQEIPDSVTTLFPWFINNPEILLRHDVDYDPQYLPIRETAQTVFNILNAQLLIPLVQSHNLLGIIIIGRKPNDKLLKPIELRFLMKLQPLATVAMNNSSLYEHVRHLSFDLLEMNKTLNDKVKKRSLELEVALAHMKKLNQEQSNFFNIASHHLRTPLTSIKAAATLLWAKNPSEKKAGLNAILMANIRRLEALIKNIIEIAKMKNGKMDLRLSRVKIHKLILTAYLEVEANFADKPLAWSFHLDEKIQTVYGDASRLKTVFIHLFSNAFKFTPEGGKVHVSMATVKRDDIDKYDLSDKPVADCYYEFSVTDTGEGIPEEEKDLIFDIFHQVSGSHKRYQGPGLGLYLVKKIIENHNGAITVQSQLNQGSKFSFILPAL